MPETRRLKEFWSPEMAEFCKPQPGLTEDQKELMELLMKEANAPVETGKDSGEIEEDPTILPSN